MYTIDTYETDYSAMGRVNAWRFAANVAMDRPLIGGGFQVFSARWFAVYAPDPNDVHDAHSIYFEVLGEQGFVGLFLFLTLLFLTWRSCKFMIQLARRDDDLSWAADLGRMCQVSLIAYSSAGAFVGLAYFDFYYSIIALVVIAKLIVLERVASAQNARGVESEPTRSRQLSAAIR
jgi:probable O-glycosylation ligase (exosortase A-associated)